MLVDKTLVTSFFPVCFLQKELCQQGNMNQLKLKYIFQPLTYIFKQSSFLVLFMVTFQLHLLLQYLKRKIRNSFLITVYRIISVLPCFGEILEKLINKRLIGYLDQNNTLFPNYGLLTKAIHKYIFYYCNL